MEKKNGKDIEIYLNNKYLIKPNYKTILKKLDKIRQAITEYLKYKYKLVQLGGGLMENITVAIDERLITYAGRRPIWMIDAINTKNKNVRLDILLTRNANALKIFVNNHIIPGTNITHYGWVGYSFLDDKDSVLTHESHNHGHGDFGTGEHSTSHIEGFWSLFKRIMKKFIQSFQLKIFFIILERVNKDAKCPVKKIKK